MSNCIWKTITKSSDSAHKPPSFCIKTSLETFKTPQNEVVFGRSLSPDAKLSLEVLSDLGKETLEALQYEISCLETKPYLDEADMLAMEAAYTKIPHCENKLNEILNYVALCRSSAGVFSLGKVARLSAELISGENLPEDEPKSTKYAEAQEIISAIFSQVDLEPLDEDQVAALLDEVESKVEALGAFLEANTSLTTSILYPFCLEILGDEKRASELAESLTLAHLGVTGSAGEESKQDLSCEDNCGDTDDEYMLDDYLEDDHDCEKRNQAVLEDRRARAIEAVLAKYYQAAPNVHATEQDLINKHNPKLNSIKNAEKLYKIVSGKYNGAKTGDVSREDLLLETSLDSKTLNSFSKEFRKKVSSRSEPISKRNRECIHTPLLVERIFTHLTELKDLRSAQAAELAASMSSLSVSHKALKASQQETESETEAVDAAQEIGLLLGNGSGGTRAVNYKKIKYLEAKFQQPIKKAEILRLHKIHYAMIRQPHDADRP